MSDVKRYSPDVFGDMRENPAGEYVRSLDFDKVAADLQEFKSGNTMALLRAGFAKACDERDALRAECERLADALDRQSAITGDYIARCQRLADELAITRRVIDRIGQLCTTPHESKERFIRRVQSVIEWQTAAQQDQPK